MIMLQFLVKIIYRSIFIFVHVLNKLIFKAEVGEVEVEDAMIVGLGLRERKARVGDWVFGVVGNSGKVGD